MKLEAFEAKIACSVSEILREAGKAIMDVYQSGFSVELKNDRSPLTKADKLSHEIVAGYLKTHSPFPVMSEEGKEIPFEERMNWEQFWLLDPLDGTKEFIKRNGEFTVNLALIRGDRPVAGAIYVPAKDILYYAAKGMGSYKQESGKTTKLPHKTRSNRFTVVGSRSHVSEEFESYVRIVEQRHGAVEIISAGSSLKFCLVAEGSADIYPRLGPTMEWDTAAGQIIVEEAGGRVLEVGGTKSLAYNKACLVNSHFIAMNMPLKAT